MKHFKLVTTMLVLLALVASVAFAAGGPTAGRLRAPSKIVDPSDQQSVKNLKTKATNQQRIPIDQSMESASFGKNSDSRSIVLTTRTITPALEALLSTSVSGTVHIGTAQPAGFKTIGDMAFIMNHGTFTASTTFLLDDAAYTEAGVAIGPSAGVSPTVTVTIRPNTGNAACVVTLTDNPANKGGMVFFDAHDVTVEGTALGGTPGARNLTIQLSASPSAANGGDAPVTIFNGINMTVTDCKIPGNSPSAAWSVGFNNGNGSVTLRADEGKYNSNVTVNNCELSLGHFGVRSVGNFPAALDQYGVQDDNINITNNYIHDVTESGINLQQVTAATVSGNIVKRVVFGSGGGASPNLTLPAAAGLPPGVNGAFLANYPLLWRVSGILVWGDQAHIYNNVVDSVWQNRTVAGTFNATAYGIRVHSFGQNDPYDLSFFGVTTLNVLVNNIVTRIYSKALQTNQPGRAVGIETGGSRQDTLYHNTVYLSGADDPTNPSGAGAIAMFISGAYQSAQGFPAWVDPATTAFFARVYAKNNILAVNRTGTTGNILVAMTTVSTPGNNDWRVGNNNNVLYLNQPGNIGRGAGGASQATVFDFVTAMGTDAASQADDPTLVSATDVHINPAGLSTADGTGANLAGRVTLDYDGVSRSTPPDIGALEGTGAGLPHDVKPFALVNPGAAGVPAGLPFSSFQVQFLNLGGFTETAFPVNIHIVDPDATVHDFPGTVTLAAGAAAVVNIAGTWTPATGGTAAFTITTALGTDNYTSNDVLLVNIPVAAQATVPYTSGFETAPDQAGWFGAGQWGIGTTGGKLGGPFAGTKYYATNPGAPASGTADANVSNLFSPFFDFSLSPSPAVMSFRLSINTEVNWDRMIAEYSIDTGATWQKLGVLNDPAGINWYGGAYANAVGSNVAPDCWDNVTAIAKGFPGDGSGANPPPAWTSNGDCLADPVGGTGPTGYVLVALDLAGHPVMGKSYVRFRFSAFTDASTHGDGWGIDDFKIGTGPTSTPADYSGKVYDDMDGNGSFGGPDVGLAGVTVTMTYYGGAHSTAVSNGSGDYLFDNLTPANSDMYYPGEYNATTAQGGVQTDEPTTTSYAGTGIASSGNNLGYYNGSISGTKWNDKDNDGIKDGGEAGLAGWTIELHADSCNGAIVGTVVTDANGNYTIGALPGTYYVSEVSQTGWRQTFPATECATVVISGLSGSGTAIVTGVNFGNYQLGSFTIQKFVDLNGDGIQDLGDVTPMGLGAIAVFDVKKNGSHLFFDTLGNGLSSVIHQNIDTGNYSVQEIATSALWIRTFPVSDTYNFTIDTSGSNRTVKYMNYKLSSVSGTKWNDLDGDGVKDSLEPGLSGWTIHMGGTMLGSADAVTDVNGNYTIDSIGGGSHTQNEIVQSDWTQTFPTGGGTYSYTGGGSLFSGSVVTGKNFGNFKNICISGTKYRDRNADGDRDAGEEGLSGWKINIGGTGGGSVTTDSLGNYSLCHLGPGAHSVAEVAQLGWTQTEGGYNVVASSGTDVTGQDFGNFQSSDSTTKYRTFGNIDWVTYAQITKVIKPPKPGKPATFPNLATLVNDYILQMAKVTDALRVGVVVPLTKKPYLQAKGYKEVMETFWKKGNVHTKSITRPFDFNNKGKIMEKRLKSLPATVQNNGLAKELLALAVNIALSDKGKTTPGLGELIYDDGVTEDDGTYCPGFPLNGKTLRQILAIANNLMTNWSGVPPQCYARLMAVVSAANNAFSCGAAVCGGASAFTYDTAAWNAGSKLHITGGNNVLAVSFIKANPGAAPVIIPDGVIATVPDQYSLYQNYPNPFNPTTSIEFDLPQDAFVTLKIFNVLGQEVATLLNHEGLSAGTEGVDFDASMLPSGVYFYRIVAEGVNDDGQVTGQTFTQVKKMMLMK